MISFFNSKLKQKAVVFLTVASMLVAFAPRITIADDLDAELAAIIAKKEDAGIATAAAQAKLDGLKNTETKLIDAKIALEERNAALENEIKLIDAEIKLYDKRVEEKEEEVKAAQEKEEEQLVKYRARVRAMEESGGYNLLDIIFNSSSFADLLSAVDDYNEIMEKDQLIYNGLQEAREEHQKVADEYTELREDCETKKAELDKEAGGLLKEIEKSETELKTLATDIADAEEELIAAQQAEAAASFAVTDFLKDYYAKKEAEEEAANRVELPGLPDDYFVNPNDPPAQQPETPANPQPEAPADPQPETPAAPQPETPADPQPETPADPQPETPADPQPETPSETLPDPLPPQTEDGGQNQPEGGSTEQPEGTEPLPPPVTPAPTPAPTPVPTPAPTPVPTPAPQPQQPSKGTGTFVWPIPGKYCITSGYGNRPSTGTFHAGIDIDGFQSMGHAVVASDSGEVIKAEYMGAYGNTIIIDHGGGYATLYAHLSSIGVSAGQKVTQGQYIGGVGNTGTVYGADGIHLHFEVRINGNTTNPLSYISGAPYYFYAG